MVPAPYGVGIWKNIRALWSCFLSNIGFKVGDGRKIVFQSSKWIGYGPLKEQFPNLFRLTLLSYDTLFSNAEQGNGT